jgi:hypothetical protein
MEAASPVLKQLKLEEFTVKKEELNLPSEPSDVPKQNESPENFTANIVPIANKTIHANIPVKKESDVESSSDKLTILATEVKDVSFQFKSVFIKY